MAVRLRPHHVLCSIGFEGKGYSDPFIANMGYVVDGQLRGPQGRDISVTITGEADSICAPCPKRRGMGCEAQAKIDGLDARHATALGVSPGDVLTWGACLDRVAERILPDDLDHICAGCSWLEQGMCKTALSRLLETETGRPRATRKAS